jgi:hypothetical protein
MWFNPSTHVSFVTVRHSRPGRRGGWPSGWLRWPVFGPRARQVRDAGATADWGSCGQLAGRPELWLGVNGRGPLTPAGIYQLVARRGEQAGVAVHPQRFRHHFSHTWLDRGGAEGDLMQLNGWSSAQMLTWYGASARGARARRSYDRIMNDAG